MLSRPKHDGFSLVEAVLAAFMLLGAILISVSVFDRTLQVEAGNEKRIVAALVAESAMAEIRRVAGNNFSQIKTQYDGKTWSLAEYPNFRIRGTVSRAILAVPCTELEADYSRTAPFPDPVGRYLDRSAWKVQLDISWVDGGSQSVRIVEDVVNFSPANDFSVQVLFNSNPVDETVTINVPKGDTRDFSVRARSGGQNIEDIQFTWHVRALTGFGSIKTVSRDGLYCQYENRYRNFKNEPKYAPGSCFLVVQATYQGREAEGKVMIENAN